MLPVIWAHLVEPEHPGAAHIAFVMTSVVAEASTSWIRLMGFIKLFRLSPDVRDKFPALSRFVVRPP